MTSTRRLQAVLRGTMADDAETEAQASREERAAKLPAPEPAAADEGACETDLGGGGFTTELDGARTLFDGATGGATIALGPGAAGPDILAHSAAAMASAAATALGEEGADSLLQYGPVRGDGRYIRELATFLTRHYEEPVDATHLTLTSGATSGCALVSARCLSTTLLALTAVGAARRSAASSSRQG